MNIDVIHLKYPFDKHYKEILSNLSPRSMFSYINQAKNSTLCWTNIHDIDITITDDISKVTCEKCLLQIRKRKLNK